VLKDNPWAMDQKAIRTLAGKIYPGGIIITYPAFTQQSSPKNSIPMAMT
jgi:hypothetical protein